MKLNEIGKFSLVMSSSQETLSLTYSVGEWWKGTPNHDQKEIAKLAIKFLEQYI